MYCDALAFALGTVPTGPQNEPPYERFTHKHKTEVTFPSVPLLVNQIKSSRNHLPAPLAFSTPPFFSSFLRCSARNRSVEELLSFWVRRVLPARLPGGDFSLDLETVGRVLRPDGEKILSLVG